VYTSYSLMNYCCPPLCTIILMVVVYCVHYLLELLYTLFSYFNIFCTFVVHNLQYLENMINISAVEFFNTCSIYIYICILLSPFKTSFIKCAFPVIPFVHTVHCTVHVYSIFKICSSLGDDCWLLDVSC